MLYFPAPGECRRHFKTFTKRYAANFSRPVNISPAAERILRRIPRQMWTTPTTPAKSGWRLKRNDFSDGRKRQRRKRNVREKSWRWQSHASLRSKVQATRRMPPKRGGDCARRRVSERCEASLAGNRAESAALSAQTPPQGQCRGMCRAKRPPKAAVRGERGQRPWS